MSYFSPFNKTAQGDTDDFADRPDIENIPDKPLLGVDGSGVSTTAGVLKRPPALAFRDFRDIPAQRQAIFTNVQDAVQERFQRLENERYRLEILKPHYRKIPSYSLKEQKEAILNRRNLDVPLYGTWRLTDKETGTPVSEMKKLVARVPYITERGTFIFRGNEYTLSNQQRLRPGIYTRRKDNGDLEAHANLMPGTGRSFRIFMEPESGVFKLRIGQAHVPALPILRALGATDESLEKAWGKDILNANIEKARNFDLNKVYDKLADSRIRRQFADPRDGLRATFERMGLDPDVAQRTLGKKYNKMNAEVLTRAMQKLLHISQGKEDQDDRDSQANQTLMSPEDLFAERISKDAGGMTRQLLWKQTNKKDVNKIPSGHLTKQLYSALLSSGLGAPLQEINPVEIVDQWVRVSRMGEGGIPSMDAVPDEARNVQPSQMGLIDPVRGPESGKIGVDTRLALGTLKGNDNQLYRRVLDSRGKPKTVSASQLSESVLVFPGEMERAQKRGLNKVRAMVNGKIKYVSPKEIDYVIPSGNDLFTITSNLVPGISGIKGGRLLMAAKMFTQALPLEAPEAPLVRSSLSDNPDSSYESEIGKHMGAVFADQPGVVEAVTDDEMTVKYGDGTRKKVQLYNNFPFNQKTFIHNTPTVKPGDRFDAGSLLARSNFTDGEGTTALGANFRVAFMPFKGNYEDGIVISESAARRLSSEHMYTVKDTLDEEGVEIDKAKFTGLYPGEFNKKQLDTIDQSGVVKVGTVLQQGDPVMLRTKRKEPPKGTSLLKQRKSWNLQDAEVWEHHSPGIVTDVSREKQGVKVAIKAYSAMRRGDKLSGRYGNKGVIGDIVPDDQMPRDANDKPFEVVLNPLGIISRVNPSQLIETALAKVARKTGKAYNLPAFTDDDYIEYALKELRDNELSDTETVFNPNSNNNIKDVFTGEQFLMKLHHTAESKAAGRDVGSYAMDMTPAKGGYAGAKRIGNLDVNALIAHGVPEVLRDAKLVRGQKNDNYWMQFRMGQTAKVPETPFVYDKFLATLQSAGVNVKRRGDSMHLSAMTDKDVDELAGNRELESGDAIDLRSEEPIKGGLFDLAITGGRDGNRWSKITLAEPMPHPLMEEPIRRLLGLTKAKFEDLLRSEHGPTIIRDRLAGVDVSKELETQKDIIRSGKKSARDNAVKLVRYLDAFKRLDVAPEEMMINKVPVMPPNFRPVAMMKGIELTSDANLLYKDLFEANKDLRELKGDLGEAPDERMIVYKALKAVVGLGEPVNIKNKEKNVAGMLTHVFGKGSPKFGMFQRKLLSTTVDTVGRTAITPDPKLDMDQVGLPEDVAWDLYRPHIMRRLNRQYSAGPNKIPMTEIAKWIVNKDPRARKAMVDEMEERPVIVSRAPVLHKYGIMGAWPVLVPGDTMRISPIVTPGFGADFDGDAMNFHVPATSEAVDEIKEKMMPSKNLISTSDFDVHWLPKQEYQLGLYTATRPPRKDVEPRKFATRQDAIKAMLKGEIQVNDPVFIVEEKI